MSGPSVIESFALTNPFGPGMHDMSTLLRKLATVLEEMDQERPLLVTDIVSRREVTGHGYQVGVRVYYTHDPRDIDASRWSVDDEPSE